MRSCKSVRGYLKMNETRLKRRMVMLSVLSSLCDNNKLPNKFKNYQTNKLLKEIKTLSIETLTRICFS